MPSPGSLDASSLFRSPLAEHGATTSGSTLGPRVWLIHFQVFGPKSLRLAPGEAAPGQEGEGVSRPWGSLLSKHFQGGARRTLPSAA